MKKRAQAWGFDLMIASVLFMGGIIFFYIYAFNTPSQGEEKLNSLTYEGNVLADSLISDGSPINWSVDNVGRIGLLSNNKINQTKLDAFYSLSQSDYPKTKALLNTRYNFFINASNPLTANNEIIIGIGLPPDNPQNLIKISRFTIYKETPVTLTIEVWE